MRLIDADKLFENGTFLINNEDSPFNVATNIINKINDVPTIDAVPVVRCKECKHRVWFAPHYGCGNFESPFYAAVDGDVAILTKPDDFCSYGAKTEDEDDSPDDLRPQGKWIEDGHTSLTEDAFCNQCFWYDTFAKGEPKYKYCPNCGARMRIESEEEK